MAAKTEYALLQRERKRRVSLGPCLDRDQIVCLRTAEINQFYQSHTALYRSEPATAAKPEGHNHRLFSRSDASWQLDVWVGGSRLAFLFLLWLWGTTLWSTRLILRVQTLVSPSGGFWPLFKQVSFSVYTEAETIKIFSFSKTPRLHTVAPETAGLYLCFRRPEAPLSSTASLQFQYWVYSPLESSTKPNPCLYRQTEIASALRTAWQTWAGPGY